MTTTVVTDDKSEEKAEAQVNDKKRTILGRKEDPSASGNNGKHAMVAFGN